MRGVINRLEVSAASLQDNAWPSDTSQAIGEAQAHIEAAYHILKTIILDSDEIKARSRKRQLAPIPQTQAEFLAMPFLQHPGISSRLHNTLWGFFKEVSKTDYRNFTAQDLLDNGLTIAQFIRWRNVGVQTVADLETIFNAHGVVIPAY